MPHVLITDYMGDDTALEEALFAQAGVNVDEEPLPERHPVRSMPQAILTPHVAYFSRASVEEAKRRSVAEILAVLDGRPPRHPVAVPHRDRS